MVHGSFCFGSCFDTYFEKLKIIYNIFPLLTLSNKTKYEKSLHRHFFKSTRSLTPGLFVTLLSRLVWAERERHVHVCTGLQPSPDWEIPDTRISVWDLLRGSQGWEETQDAARASHSLLLTEPRTLLHVTCHNQRLWQYEGNDGSIMQ